MRRNRYLILGFLLVTGTPPEEKPFSATFGRGKESCSFSVSREKRVEREMGEFLNLLI